MKTLNFIKKIMASGKLCDLGPRVHLSIATSQYIVTAFLPRASGFLFLFLFFFKIYICMRERERESER